MAPKKGMTTIFISPLSFIAVFGSGNLDPGSGIRNPGSGIRDPGSGINIPDPQHCRERTEEDREEAVIRRGSIKSKYSKMSEADLYGFSCPRYVNSSTKLT
jgi:hypothetical protein